jgi:hypothetical protein
MVQIIKQRRDTAANWTAANPVLALGEIGWETDTRKAKLGDGSTAFNSLAYIHGQATADYVAQTITNGVTTSAPSQDAVFDALALKIDSTEKGAANGVATLDAGSKIPTAQLPAIAITDTFVVASQAAQVALTAQTGDVAVRTDLSKSYILAVNDPTIFANWQELLTPTDAVTSVNGQTGTVVLSTTNIAEGTALYFTDERAQDAIGAMVDATLVYVDGTPLLTRGAITGDISIPQASNTATLATVNANVGSFTLTNLTVNAKGLITAAATATAIPNGVTATTQADNDNSTKVATTAYVDNHVIDGGGA